MTSNPYGARLGSNRYRPLARTPAPDLDARAAERVRAAGLDPAEVRGVIAKRQERRNVLNALVRQRRAANYANRTPDANDPELQTLLSEMGEVNQGIVAASRFVRPSAGDLTESERNVGRLNLQVQAQESLLNQKRRLRDREMAEEDRLTGERVTAGSGVLRRRYGVESAPPALADKAYRMLDDEGQARAAGNRGLLLREDRLNAIRAEQTDLEGRIGRPIEFSDRPPVPPTIDDVTLQDLLAGSEAVRMRAAEDREEEKREVARLRAAREAATSGAEEGATRARLGAYMAEDEEFIAGSTEGNRREIASRSADAATDEARRQAALAEGALGSVTTANLATQEAQAVAEQRAAEATAREAELGLRRAGVGGSLADEGSVGVVDTATEAVRKIGALFAEDAAGQAPINDVAGMAESIGDIEEALSILENSASVGGADAELARRRARTMLDAFGAQTKKGGFQAVQRRFLANASPGQRAIAQDTIRRINEVVARLEAVTAQGGPRSEGEPLLALTDALGAGTGRILRSATRGTPLR